MKSNYQLITSLLFAHRVDFELKFDEASDCVVFDFERDETIYQVIVWSSGASEVLIVDLELNEVTVIQHDHDLEKTLKDNVFGH